MSDIKTICLKAFEDKFGTKPQMQEYAPGRVNMKLLRRLKSILQSYGLTTYAV